MTVMSFAGPWLAGATTGHVLIYGPMILRAIREKTGTVDLYARALALNLSCSAVLLAVSLLADYLMK